MDEGFAPMEPQAVPNPAEILLVAGQPREVEGEEHLPLFDTRHQLEEPRPVVARCPRFAERQGYDVMLGGLAVRREADLARIRAQEMRG